MSRKIRGPRAQFHSLAAVSLLAGMLGCAEQPHADLQYAAETNTNTLELKGNIDVERGISPVESNPRLIDEAVERVDGEYWVTTVRELTGDKMTTVNGNAVMIDSRHSSSQGNTIAGNYLFERFSDLGLEVEFQNFDTNTGTERNIIATLPGTSASDEIILLGAHYDSTSPQPNNAPGADDNASGTAALLEVARILSEYEFERTIQFIAFGAEEQGLIGSRVFVDELGADKNKIQGAVIMDMIGYYNNKFSILVEGKLPYFGWMQYAVDAAKDYADIGTKRSFYSFGSDHVSFQNARIPAYLLIEQEWNSASHYHSTSDTVDIIRPEVGYEVSRIAVAVLGETAGIQSRRNANERVSQDWDFNADDPAGLWGLTDSNLITGWKSHERNDGFSPLCRHDHPFH